MKPELYIAIGSLGLLLLASMCQTAAVDTVNPQAVSAHASLLKGASFEGLQAVVQEDVNFFRRMLAGMESTVQQWHTSGNENAAQDTAALKRRRIFWQQLSASTFG